MVNVEGKSKLEASRILEENGLSREDADLMYKWLAIGKERWIIPTSKKELRISIARRG